MLLTINGTIPPLIHSERAKTPLDPLVHDLAYLMIGNLAITGSFYRSGHT